MRSRCPHVYDGALCHISPCATFFLLFKHLFFLLTSITAPSMPPKRTVAPGTSKNLPITAPSKSTGRQRTSTNKQQQICKIPSFFVVLPLPNFSRLLAAQKKEKEEAAKQRALTDAIRSEQCQEEFNGFHKNKLPSNLSPFSSTLLLIYF